MPNPEKAAPFELGGGDDACLLIHGFTGSPWDMRPLGEGLAARGFHVRGLRLPGHASTPDALSQVTHRDWEEAVESALLSLKNFRHVFVAGLSMGALLSIVLAARHQDRVHGLALMAPALHFHHPYLRSLKRLQRLPLLQILRPRLAKQTTDLEDPAERAEAPLLPYVPSVRLRDLWWVQDAARAALPLVRTPVLVATATHDHVVHSEKVARELADKLAGAPLVRFLQIDRGFHIMPRDLGRQRLIAEVGGFFEHLRA